MKTRITLSLVEVEEAVKDWLERRQSVFVSKCESSDWEIDAEMDFNFNVEPV
jgi:hypothetical protein